MFREYPDLMSVDDVQSALGIGRSTAYRLVRRGDIRHLRIGRAIKIPRRYLVEYVEAACYNGEVATKSPSRR